MKKFLLSIIVLVSIGQVYAQSALLIAENFTGYSGNLNTQSSGQGSPQRWTTSSTSYGSDFVQVSNSAPLFYAGYTSGSQYVNLTARDEYTSGPFWNLQYYFPDDPTKEFISNTDVSVSTATTFYTSFVVRVNGSSNVSNISSATQTFALRTDDGDNLANFYIGKNNSNQLKFGINKLSGADAVYSSATYNYAQTYLIVLRYDIVAGNRNDKFYMWVNPILSSEPSTGSAAASIISTANSSGNNDGYTVSSGNPVNAIQLFQDDNSATASLDAFRVAYSKSNSATSWATLNPIGVPLPVKFGDIKGYEKGDGVQVDWDVYAEFNVLRYEIERSTDGVSYSSIGRVAARNEDGKLSYDFYDAVPASGNNYYRIKNVDIDGKWSYSSIVKISLGKSARAGITVYPNPVVNKHVSLQSSDLQKGVYKIEVYSTVGQQVYQKQFSHAGGAISQSIELPAVIQPGMYNIQLTGTTVKLAKQFLIQ